MHFSIIFLLLKGLIMTVIITLQALNLTLEVAAIARLFQKNAKRTVFFFSAVLLVVCGITVRRFGISHPCFFCTYFPDTAWAMLVYCGFGFVFCKGVKLNLPCALLFSYLIEISQLFSPEFLVRARHTVLGGLILGYGFLWSDILCYSVGIVICSVIEFLLSYIIKKR